MRRLMYDIAAEVVQIADLSWDIRMEWYGKSVILNGFSSAEEAVAELMSLYPDQHLLTEIVPVTSFTSREKEKTSA